MSTIRKRVPCWRPESGRPPWPWGSRRAADAKAARRSVRPGYSGAEYRGGGFPASEQQLRLRDRLVHGRVPELYRRELPGRLRGAVATAERSDHHHDLLVFLRHRSRRDCEPLPGRRQAGDRIQTSPGVVPVWVLSKTISTPATSAVCWDGPPYTFRSAVDVDGDGLGRHRPPAPGRYDGDRRGPSRVRRCKRVLVPRGQPASFEPELRRRSDGSPLLPVHRSAQGVEHHRRLQPRRTSAPTPR